MARSEYVARIRRKIGNDLLLMPSVAVIVRDDRGRLLMVKSHDSGQWQTIGGAIDIDEDPADAARREAMEEAGVTVELLGVIGATGGPEFRIVYPNGDVAAYVSIAYEARVVSGEPKPDGVETTDTAWVDPENPGDKVFTQFTVHLLNGLGIS